MKWLIGIFSIVTMLLDGCKSAPTMLRYLEKRERIVRFSYKIEPNDAISQLVSLFPQTVEKHSENPMFIQIEFKGQRIYAEKLLSMDLKMYAKNDKTGLYDVEVSIKNTYSHYDFPYYSYNRYGYGEKNYKGELNKLMYPSDRNKPDRINSLFVDNELILTDYPKEVKAIILVKWIGGERELVTFLTLDEYKAGANVRTNPFG